MAFLADRVLDNGLTVLDTEANKITITSLESTTYASANSTHALGSSTSLSIGSPADRSAGGREVTVSAISDGSVSGNGTASHFAILDTSNSRLLATGSLSAPQTVSDGNTFTLASFKIGIPDPS